MTTRDALREALTDAYRAWNDQCEREGYEPWPDYGATWLHLNRRAILATSDPAPALDVERLVHHKDESHRKQAEFILARLTPSPQPTEIE